MDLLVAAPHCEDVPMSPMGPVVLARGTGLSSSRQDTSSKPMLGEGFLDGAEAEAEHMNCDRSKYGFFTQVSADSDLSGVSTTFSLEELSDPAFFSHQCSEIDAMASRVIGESKIKEAIREAVEDGQFCVTIADPRSPDIPLIAVSEKFENITGYRRAEVLGKNCRFLNSGCIFDPVDLMQLRSACDTGATFTAVLTNRRKSGEFFLNLLDLRGLTVARSPCTGEELWFLVGIQADVTNAGLDDMKGDHITEMHSIANGIREKLADQLSAMAISGALMTNFCVADNDQSVSDAWCLLPSPLWRCGESTHLPVGMATSPWVTAECHKVKTQGAAEGTVQNEKMPKAWFEILSGNDDVAVNLMACTVAAFLGGVLLTQFLAERVRR